MGDLPSSVAELLQRAELTQYAAAFEEEGWDSVTQLLQEPQNILNDDLHNEESSIVSDLETIEGSRQAVEAQSMGR